MEKTIKTFKSFTEADAEDKRYYHSLSPAQRLNILLTLIAQRHQADETAKRFARVYRVVKLA